MVGEKGVTLSGGEKARVVLARAIYSKADIYLFDNLFSPVDSKMARKIFFRCIKPLSKQKTVLMITHNLNFLKRCNEVLVIADGTIENNGPPSTLTSILV